MTVGNLKIFGLPDLFALPSSHVSTTTDASADFPKANLLTEVPSDTWRSLGYSPGFTYIRDLTLTRGGNFADMVVGGVGLVNHNLWPWSGNVRFIMFDDDSALMHDMFEMLVPLSIVASTNKNAGVVGNIDNGIYSVNTDSIGPLDPTLAWSITLAMEDPSDDPITGSRMQTVAVKVASVADRDPHEALTVTLLVGESGAGYVTVGQKSVCRSDGHWLLFTFDASMLSNPTGADLELKLVMGVDATLSAPSEYTTILEVCWMCETLTGVSTSAGFLMDSGWLPVGVLNGNPLAGGPTYQPYLPQELTQGDCVAWDVADHSANRVVTAVRTVAVIIREDHSPDHLDYDVLTFPIRPPGYVEVGHVVGCAEVFTTQVNYSIGPLDGVRDLSVTKFTQGGNQYGQRNGILRTATLDFPALTSAEKAFIKDRILRRRGTSRPILYSLMPGDPFESEALTFYATISQQETVASTQLIEDYRRRMSFSLVEYL